MDGIYVSMQSKMTNKEFHLSVVATSRNDNHGGDLLNRMQQFVDGFVIQCKRHQLKAELILVEWNPPLDKKPLAEALRFPADKGPCGIRIITVPPELHATIKQSDRLPLFQMIAKNVGIRRALGKYILATNIDILFSDDIIRFMRNQLRLRRLYRVDRIDVSMNTTVNSDFEKTLVFCEGNKLRVHRKKGSYLKANNRWQPCFKRKRELVSGRILRLLKMAKDALTGLTKELLNHHAAYSGQPFRQYIKNIIIKSRRGLFIYYKHPIQFIKLCRTRLLNRYTANRRPFQKNIITKGRLGLIMCYKYIKRRLAKVLHTNACGDFTLLSCQDWFKLRGYPEWPMFSWHLDSILLYQANRSNIKEIDLPPHMSIYHIEHSIGSGYTPEGVDQLFRKIEANKIENLDFPKFLQLIEEMDRIKKQKKVVMYNEENWGLANHLLAETWV